MKRTTTLRTSLCLLAAIFSCPADVRAAEEQNVWKFVQICELPVESNNSTSSGLAVADFDRDGQQDIIAVETLVSLPPNWIATAYAFYNTENCHFTTSILLPPASTYGYFTRSADLNNDGWPDAVFGSHEAKHVFLNDGQGALAEVWSDPIGYGGGGIDLVDVNGDGFRDLASGAQTDSGALLSVYLNDGRGSFVPSWTSQHYGANHAVFEDTLVANLNNDPYPDIVATIWQNPEKLMTFLGDGTGTNFVPHEQISPIGGRFYGLTVGKVNGDIRDDVAIHDSGGPLRVFVSHEDGRLIPYWESAQSFRTDYDVTLADMDADGFDDLFAREFHSGEMRIYHNVRSDERFRLVWMASGDLEVAPGTIADFDNDGFSDIIVRDAHRIRVLRNMNGVTLKAQRFSAAASFELCVTGVVGCSYRLQTANALPATTWTDLLSFRLSSRATNLVDATATNFTQRFYRLISP
jgi:hypothetical protein